MWRTHFSLWAAALGGGAALVAAGPAAAQHHGGAAHGGAAHVSTAHYHGGHSYGGYHHYYPSYYPGFYRPGFSLSIGLGSYYRYPYAYGYPAYGYPSYGYSSYTYPSYAYSNYYVPQSAPVVQAQYVVPQTPATPAKQPARLEVLVPDGDAEVWLDDYKTTSRGTTRVLESPPLEPGGAYSYTIKASWAQGDKTVTQQRKVDVTPGRTVVVDFNRPEPEKVPAPTGRAP